MLAEDSDGEIDLTAVTLAAVRTQRAKEVVEKDEQVKKKGIYIHIQLNI